MELRREWVKLNWFVDGMIFQHLYFSNFWYTDCHDSEIPPPEFAKQLGGESYAKWEESIITPRMVIIHFSLFLKAQLNAIERLSIPMKFIDMDMCDLVGLLLWDLFDPGEKVLIQTDILWDIWDLPQLSEDGKKIVTEYRKQIRENWIDHYKDKGEIIFSLDNIFLIGEVDEPERRFIQLADLHKVVQVGTEISPLRDWEWIILSESRSTIEKISTSFEYLNYSITME